MALERPQPIPAQVAEPPRRPLLVLVKYWGVVVAWMGIISLLSGEPFSAANTNRYLDPVLRFFFPHMTQPGFALAHTVVRKCAHFTEFFVLGSLTYWACRRGRAPRWRRAWMWQALALAVMYSLVDEAHQAFVPNRTASLLDATIDSFGALISQAVIRVRAGRVGSSKDIGRAQSTEHRSQTSGRGGASAV